MTKNKTKNLALLLALILTFSTITLVLPVIAQNTKTSFPFIGVVPNPIGVNQEVLLHVGITDAIGTTADGWSNLTVTVTKPDGTSETLGPFRTDSTGGTGTIYIPTLVGTYTFQTHFPEQVAYARVSGVPIGTIMAISHFCKPTKTAEWNFDHPKVSNVLDRDELNTLFGNKSDEEKRWTILKDETRNDGDHVSRSKSWSFSRYAHALTILFAPGKDADTIYCKKDCLTA